MQGKLGYASSHLACKAKPWSQIRLPQIDLRLAERGHRMATWEQGSIIRYSNFWFTFWVCASRLRCHVSN